MKTRKLLMAAMTVFSVMFFSACEEDKCKDIVCQNDGVCVDGDCVCATGYEGTLCETLSRAKFIGSFSVTDACSASGSATYTTGIATSSAAVDRVLITNFWDVFTNTVVASISGNTITIADQEPDNDGFRVSGSGTINAAGTSITINYSVVEGTNTDVCQSTWTKQ